jgi:phage terminase large subunit-like protein
LNQRVDLETPFIDRALWAENNGAPLPLEKCEVIYGGLDLSETRDLTALVLVGVDKEGQHHVHPFCWLPYQDLKQKSIEDSTPYDVWASNGLLLTTPGRSIDYDYVASYMYDLYRKHGEKIQKIAFDRALMKHFRPALFRAGFTGVWTGGDEQDADTSVMKDFGQGFLSMAPATRNIENLLLRGKISHGNHPVLTMCMANARVEMDPAGNRKLTKKKSRGRIDAAVSLVMACAMATEYAESLNNKKKSYLETEDLLVF